MASPASKAGFEHPAAAAAQGADDRRPDAARAQVRSRAAEPPGGALGVNAKLWRDDKEVGMVGGGAVNVCDGISS